MDTQQIDEKAVFNAARRIADRAARDDYLAQACGDDQPAIERIRELLRIHEEEQSFLESPPAGYAATADQSPLTERSGTIIGPYKLLQQIGEGGMGVVFMAEQTEPLQRTVALKIIKPGMDTRQVIARFEAERQALAMMDHPNIARVLDAGTTGEKGDRNLLPERPEGSFAQKVPVPFFEGRPYFVMELVKGVPITKYCDEKHLPLRARLELFVEVCQAVQHAHQKGIIHRDIKPNNVLVAEYDNHAVPKVIDFGVAKATAQRLTERTMFTEFGQVIGTVEYMSPEQAKLNQLDIDTRSDVYSLGVLLYELLTGSTPFEQKRLREAAFDEVLRIIREEEPPKPSTRLKSSGTVPILPSPRDKMGLSPSPATSLASIAANRHTEPARLSKDVQGELDWIVMKALEKDRNRRYEAASALAADIMHYLTDEPVSAAAPSRLYRASKFVRRNKGAVIASAAVLAGLIAGIVGTTISLVSLSRQHAIAERERIQAELNLASVLQSQSKFDDAARLYRKSLQTSAPLTVEDRRRNARTLLDLGLTVRDGGEADRLYHESLAAHREAFPPSDPSIAHALIIVGIRMRDANRLAEAEAFFREAHEIHRKAVPADHFATALSSDYLANVLSTLGKNIEAESIMRDSIANFELAVPRNDFAIGSTRAELAKILIALGKFREAETQLLEAMRGPGTTHKYYCTVAMVALYTAWDLAEPGKGYDAKAREWTLRILNDFFKPRGPAVQSEGATK